MKLINNFKSPNFDSRKKKRIKFIIIHYTALKNKKEAVNHLIEKKNKVSSHFLICQNGLIYILVKENKRAWHAGLSFWNNITDINSHSIGIELDYSFNNNNNKFTNKMINSLQYLLRYLVKKYKIKQSNIIGHSDIAPTRKQDPGPKFPWHELEKFGLVFKVRENFNFDLMMIIFWFKKHKIKTKRDISIFILSYIGYNTLEIINKPNLTKKLITNYQSRYTQFNVTGKIDNITYDFLLKHFLSLILTKG